MDELHGIGTHETLHTYLPTLHTYLHVDRYMYTLQNKWLTTYSLKYVNS
jgi:hypothetical protein